MNKNIFISFIIITFSYLFAQNEVCFDVESIKSCSLFTNATTLLNEKSDNSAFSGTCER